MSIGNTSSNSRSDQLLSQLQDLQQSGLGNRQLVLGPNQVSAKKTPFERFCNWFTGKPSPPRQGNALQNLKTMLEQDYGSAGKSVFSSLVGNKKPITVKEAIEGIKQAKAQFQCLQNALLTDVQQTARRQFGDGIPPDLESTITQMMQVLKLETSQAQVLHELVLQTQDPEEIRNLALVATGDPEYIKQSLADISNLPRESQLQELSTLLQQINQATTLDKLVEVLQLDPNSEPARVLGKLVCGTQDPKEILAFAHAAISDPTGVRNFLSNLSEFSQDPQLQELSSRLQNIARSNFVEAQRLGSALAKMIKSVQPNEVQKQVLGELVGRAKDPKEILAFARGVALNHPVLASSFLSNLSRFAQDPQLQELSSWLQDIARSNFTRAQRLGSALASMIKSVQPNEAQKQVLCEFVEHTKDLKKISAFAYVAVHNPIGAREFLSHLVGLEPNAQSQEFSNLLPVGDGPRRYTQCVCRLHAFSCKAHVTAVANSIRDAMQSNPDADGLTRATQGATEIAKHLITLSGQLADENIIGGLKSMLAEGDLLPGTNNTNLVQQLDRLLHNQDLREVLANIGQNGIAPASQRAIRETLGLPPDAPITAKEAQQAALAALLSPLRQGDIGSCFVTSVAIDIHDTRPLEMLRDMTSLIERGYMERRNGHAHIQVPFNQSLFNQQAATITGNPLLRCWEYTLATSSERQACSARNRVLISLAGQVLPDDESVNRFMQNASFEYDASKRITVAALDGRSIMGTFTLTYTSPSSGQKSEIRTPQELHQALQEFSGKPLTVTPKFEARAQRILALLGGGVSEDIFRAQYGLQDIHKTTTQGFQSLPGALLDVAGQIASEAQNRGVPIPSNISMRNHGHSFNMRLNDPILREGIRTGAWESPKKRQDFLRQQLMQPMLAKTLDPDNEQSGASISQFFNDLKNNLVSLEENAPSRRTLRQLFDRITGELQGKISYADLAKAAYQALQQEFPGIPDATLQENIMRALAPMCPQMMFADTNWEEDGQPIHWGIQFNPITDQFGIVQGMQNDSGKYSFEPPQMSESTFDKCEIIDDPRVLLKTQ
ncbi:MAG: hypothetical protein LBF43_01235 [Puniceicoccales bacterium]|jgi:hypothetical protein|nr:hypothetical protein [Puniceicoccales bacterium]